MSTKLLITLLKRRMTPKVYARYRRELNDLEWTIAIENMAAAHNALREEDLV